LPVASYRERQQLCEEWLLQVTGCRDQIEFLGDQKFNYRQKLEINGSKVGSNYTADGLSGLAFVKLRWKVSNYAAYVANYGSQIANIALQLRNFVWKVQKIGWRISNIAWKVLNIAWKVPNIGTKVANLCFIVSTTFASI
jgi:hypothetical protein